MNEEQQQSIDSWKEIVGNAAAMGETLGQKLINDSFTNQLLAIEKKLQDKNK